MQSSDLLNLDLRGSDAAQLRAAIAHRHGANLADAIAILDRAMLIRSPWAPGLRLVGGILKLPNEPSGEVSARNVAGSGLSLEDAFASCLGEASERHAQMRPPRTIRTATLETPQSSCSEAIASLIRKLTAMSDDPVVTLYDALEGCSLGGDVVHVPVDWCLRRSNPGRLGIPGAALSVGCAAGPTPESASARALLELIERDAASLWWGGGRRARQLDQGEYSGAEQILMTLRADSPDRVTTLLDITTEFGVPVIAAVSTDRAGGLFAAGLGCRLSRGAAARAALLELCQMEVGLQLALMKRDHSDEAALGDDDRRHLLRAAAIVMASDRRFAADEPLREPVRVADADDLAHLRSTFMQSGFQAALIDLTQPENGVPVIKAIAPDLQLLPSKLATPRLQAHVAGNTQSGNAFLDIPLV